MTAKRLIFEVAPVRKPSTLWKVIRTGDLISTFRTQRQAIARAVEIARKEAPAELRIKGRNGKVRDSRTYGADPRRTKG